MTDHHVDKNWVISTCQLKTQTPTPAAVLLLRPNEARRQNTEQEKAWTMHDESLAWIQETDPALMCTLQGIYAYKRRLRARKPSGRPDVKTTFGKFRFYSPKSPIDLCEVKVSKPRLSDNSMYPGLGEDFELPLAGTGDIKADLNCERRFDSRSSNSEKSAPPPASESAKLLEEMSHIVKILRAFSCSEPTVDCKVQSTSTTFKGDRKMWCTEATRYTRVLS